MKFEPLFITTFGGALRCLTVSLNALDIPLELVGLKISSTMEKEMNGSNSSNSNYNTACYLSHRSQIARDLREREIFLFFSVVTSTRYGTKTPPGQQPTKPCAGDMPRRNYLHMFPSMVFVRYARWFGMRLCVFRSHSCSLCW